MWREDPSSTMVIGWNQVSGKNPVIYYDVVDYGQDVLLYSYSHKPDKVLFSKGMNNHFVRLKNLSASTTYYMVIQDNEGCSKRLSFKTAPDNPYERLSIIAGGDSRNFREARQSANKLVAKLRPHCVMFGGDMTGGDRASQWALWFDDWQLTISPDGHMTPIIAARGNHEASNSSLTDLFDVPSDNVYYALSLGGNLLRIYTLNSLLPSGGDQKRWLENDLQNHRDHIWKTAQYHYSMRPHTARKSERNSQILNWANLFHQYQLNLAVESDAHCVKWTYPIRPSRESGNDEGFIRDDMTGTVYVGEGCWGAPLRANNDDKKWTRNSGSFNQFKWIFVDFDRIEVRTIKTDRSDDVGSVEPYDIFTPPRGLNLWQPSNGSVVFIERYEQLAQVGSMTATNEFRPVTHPYINTRFVKNPTSDTKPNFHQTDIRINKLSVVREEIGIAVRWSTEDKLPGNASFEVQRSVDGKTFQTIARLNGTGGAMDSYLVHDINYKGNPAFLSYRIKYKSPSTRTGVSLVREVTPGSYENNDFKLLSPATENGIVRAQYKVKNTSNVNIRLQDHREKILADDHYKNQRSGNYLRSIDMKNYPNGKYLLTITANESVIEQYLVVK